GNVDFRKNIGGGSQDDDRAQNQNQERDHDEGIRPIEGDSNNPHSRAYTLDELRDEIVSEIADAHGMRRYASVFSMLRRNSSKLGRLMRLPWTPSPKNPAPARRQFTAGGRTKRPS